MWHTNYKEKELIFLINSLVLNLYFSIILERSKNDVSEVKMISFLSSSSERYIYIYIIIWIYIYIYIYIFVIQRLFKNEINS